MAKFILHWLGGKKENVEGSDIADGCRKAGIGGGALSALDYYEEVKEAGENSKVQVAVTVDCGCVHSAEEGTACVHDLEKAGLASLTVEPVQDRSDEMY